MTLANILAVADAVLYEGYLLYPYRSSSSKNQSRWQFGVLGPPGASLAGLGEDSAMHTECLVIAGADGDVAVHLRFLQLQSRLVEQADPTGSDGFFAVGELRVGERTFLTWDEAIEQHVELGPFRVDQLRTRREIRVEVEGGEELEPIEAAGQAIGRVVRRRWPLRAAVGIVATLLDGGAVRLALDVENVVRPAATTRAEATRVSLLGAHLVLEARDAAFVSLLEPPDALREPAALCENRRCWPVLAGDEGSRAAMLVSPIILYDYPEVAPQSVGSLFDSTEIDEILTLRVMTLTDEEKAQARATDPAAAAIIDRCDAMTPDQLAALHGVLRDRRAGAQAPEGIGFVLEGELPRVTGSPGGDPFGEVPMFVTPTDEPARAAQSPAPWWDPGVDASVSPTTDVVVIEGVAVAKGSAVRLHPSRAADAQDLFFADEPATVTAIFADVDGGTHVAVVLDNDPAADLHEWYGRYLYFSPEEIEPLGRVAAVPADHAARGAAAGGSSISQEKKMREKES